MAEAVRFVAGKNLARRIAIATERNEMIGVLQEIGSQNVSLKGLRGLTADYALMQSQFYVAAHIAVMPQGVQLKPGEETSVPVNLPDLPANADIRRLTATINVQPDDSSGQASLSQGAVIEEGGNKKTFNVDISLPQSPRNLALRLEGGETFWTLSGLSVEGDHSLPDFTEQANLYLDKLPPKTEQVSLNFLVKSDAAGRVSINIADIEYAVIQTKSWSNPLDNTVRLDRTLQLDFGGTERIELDKYAGRNPSAVLLSAVGTDLGGEFAPDRLFGGVEAHLGREFATVSGDYALAQGVEVDPKLSPKPLRVSGLTAAWKVESEAELYIELQGDAAGSPASEAPLAKANLTIAPNESETANWVLASFDSSVELQPEKLYWAVIKGVRGKALLGLQTQSESFLKSTLVNRGGQLWKNVSPDARTSALLRLVYTPDPDNQTAAVEIGLEGQVPLRVDPGQATQTVSLKAATAADELPVVVVKSHAKGTLSIANVIQTYTERKAGIAAGQEFFKWNKG